MEDIYANKKKGKRQTKKKRAEKQFLYDAYKLFGCRDPFMPRCMQQTFTVMSTRIYLYDLDKETLQALLKLFADYNRAKEWFYNRKYDSEFLGIPFKDEVKKLKAYFREEMGLDPMDYYATSIESCVGGMIKSQKELLKLYAEEHAI